jgi:DnaJ-class molecular chaperone
MSQMREECPTCGGQGAVIISEVNDQYDRTHLTWEDCRTCGGEGSVEIEPEDD